MGFRLQRPQLGMAPNNVPRLAELFYVLDEEEGIISQQRAAALLAVSPGCGEAWPWLSAPGGYDAGGGSGAPRTAVKDHHITTQMRGTAPQVRGLLFQRWQLNWFGFSTETQKPPKVEESGQPGIFTANRCG